jgi:CRP/FNR family transcriptional regulator
MRMQKSGILDLFAVFRDSQPETRREMLAAARPVTLKKGTIYIDDGGRTDVMALVGDGHLRVFKSSESGREITLYGVGAGEFCLLNLLCVLTGVRAPATARVEETVHAVVFRGDEFRHWVGSDAAIRTQVFSLLASSVVATMSLVEEIAFKKMDVRLAAYLWAHLPGHDAGAQVDLTHEQIAADLGSAREVISRLLKEFERQGAVSLGRGRISLSDPDTLRALAQGV